MSEKLETLKQRMIETFKKKGDKTCLMSPNGQEKCSWTGNEIATEIENETEFGLHMVDNMLQLTIDLLSRDKMSIASVKNIYTRAIEVFGVDGQIDMLHEEIGELMQAVNKLKRLEGIKSDHIVKPNAESTIAYCLAYWNLCSEIADVKLLINQFEAMLSTEAIELSTQRKLQRLKERLDARG